MTSRFFTTWLLAFSFERLPVSRLVICLILATCCLATTLFLRSFLFSLVTAISLIYYSTALSVNCPLRLGAASSRLAQHLEVGSGFEPLYKVLQTSRSEEHTSELQSLMRISYAVFCLKKKKKIR